MFWLGLSALLALWWFGQMWLFWPVLIIFWFRSCYEDWEYDVKQKEKVITGGDVNGL